MQYFAALQHDWAAGEANGEDLEEIDAGSSFLLEASYRWRRL